MMDEYLQKLKAAYYSGSTSISMDGRTVSFRSLDEIRQLVAELEKELSEEPLPARRINYQAISRGKK